MWLPENITECLTRFDRSAFWLPDRIALRAEYLTLVAYSYILSHSPTKKYFDLQLLYYSSIIIIIAVLNLKMPGLPVPSEEKLLIQLEDMSPSKSESTDAALSIKSGVCMHFLVGKPCAESATCKKHHLTLDQLLDTKLSFNEAPVDQDKMTANQAQVPPDEEEVTIKGIPEEDAALSMTDSDDEKARPTVKAGLCMQFFKHKPCRYGDACKNHHLTIEQLMEIKPSINHESEDHDSKGFKKVQIRPALAMHQIEKKLERDLYKSKLCAPYQDGKCNRDSKCSYIHITGPDAKLMVGESRD